MKARYIAVIGLVTVLTASLLSVFIMVNLSKEEYVDVFVGIDAAYDSIEEIKTLVDAVSPYTNVFVIGSTGITHNETKLEELSQYVYDKGLSFIIYTEMVPPNHTQISDTWIRNAKAKWGNRFLGLYIHDEIGGKQLDLFVDEKDNVRHPVKEAVNYTDARNQFVEIAAQSLNWVRWNYTDVDNLQYYTSDYALYWFDYKAGYDTIFAEFGWNYSQQLNVALVRGAASAQQKDWGAILTWKYDEAPYLESGEELYEDMVLAYENGAKYILIFDTNEDYTHGVLTEAHLQAIKQFTRYAHENPRTNGSISERTAFVLPKDFAYGFRGPEDKIWGLWEASEDTSAFDISFQLGNLLEQHDNKLDVIYDDEVDYYRLSYSQYIFWNGTIVGG